MIRLVLGSLLLTGCGAWEARDCYVSGTDCSERVVVPAGETPTSSADTEQASGGDNGLSDPGPRGPMGPAGNNGQDGAAGGKGDKGDAGPPGPSGPPGSQGPRGQAGSPGVAGTPGSNGTNGNNGKSLVPKLITVRGIQYNSAVATEPSPGVGYIILPTQFLFNALADTGGPHSGWVGLKVGGEMYCYQREMNSYQYSLRYKKDPGYSSECESNSEKTPGAWVLTPLITAATVIEVHPRDPKQTGINWDWQFSVVTQE